jgi:peroxiredoxin family protein
MTIDLFDWDSSEFIDDISHWVGAASVLPSA